MWLQMFRLSLVTWLSRLARLPKHTQGFALLLVIGMVVVTRGGVGRWAYYQDGRLRIHRLNNEDAIAVGFLFYYFPSGF